LPGEQGKNPVFQGVKMINHMVDRELRQMIKAAKVIICRPGYSTLMDLAVLGRTAVLVPTPGQTEQEYLADYLSSGGLFLKMDQRHFDLETAIESGKKLNNFVISGTGAGLLEKRISNLSLRSGKKD
jgi:UDP-N-acetylglucosamine:LPS N-acetylglucosamine transferase